MPDISMCLNKSCPARKSCFRYIAKPNDFKQSYSHFEQVDGECAHFWDASKHDPRELEMPKESEGE